MEPHNTPPTEPTNTPQESPEQGASPNTPPQEQHFGGIIGIGIVVLLLLLGGLYYFFWYNPTENNTEPEPTAEEIQAQMENDPVVNDLEAQSTSNDVSSIESDLEATSFSELDADLANIDQEFEN